MIDEALVARLAQLAALELAPDERVRLSAELARIVDYVDVLRELDDVALPDPPAPEASARRADEPRPSLPRELALGQAPKQEAGGFAVPQFVDEG